MGKRTVIGSSLSAVIFAALLYFIIYFFVPTLADPFFGISYQGKRDVDQLKTSVTEILEKARVPQVEIDQYVAQFDTQEFYQQLHSRSVQGEEAILDYLDSLKSRVDFTSFEDSQLKTVLADGFAQTSRFTQNQLRALERLLKGTLDSL
ncbi:MAG: hypothetical protein JXK93_08005 [Sphaerochaetaceae bacterium]|nr:hypothetical protein [Sphaerochaetaceae bacterium]